MLLPIDCFPYINKLSRLQFHLKKKVQKQWEFLFLNIVALILIIINVFIAHWIKYICNVTG